MPSTKEETVIRNKSGEHWLQKHYLTLNLKDARALFLESWKQEDKSSFSAFFGYYPENENVLLSSRRKEQCRYQLYENLIMKSEIMDYNYGKVWWNTAFCDTSVNRKYWKNNSVDSKDRLKFITTKNLPAITFYK